MNTVTLKDIDLVKYLKMSKLNETFISQTKQFIKKHSSMLLKDYLTKFLRDYDNTCEYFCDFYFDLFNDLGLYDFHRQTFELTII